MVLYILWKLKRIPLLFCFLLISLVARDIWEFHKEIEEEVISVPSIKRLKCLWFSLIGHVACANVFSSWKKNWPSSSFLYQAKMKISLTIKSKSYISRGQSRYLSKSVTLCLVWSFWSFHLIYWNKKNSFKIVWNNLKMICKNNVRMVWLC